MIDASFRSLSLNSALLRALEDEGYEAPTPIQRQAIPLVMAGRDLMATAQTGTGKTAAFALPILHRLALGRPRGRGLRALIVTPTRELALQIEASLRAYGRHLPLRVATVLGGVAEGPQIQALRRRPDLLVATPGRLLDLMGQGHVSYDGLEVLVLDEADRMLDMGFIRDVRRIIDALPARRQSLLFSATLPREIAELATEMLDGPASVAVAPPAAVADNITQRVLFVDQADKKDLLAEVLRGSDVRRALVFTRTKHRANRVAQQLSREGIAADAIHSNKSQGARQRALAAFDGGRTRVLVATDLMARGIDVEDITHVINFELPNEPASYVHRIGRTARAGAAGVALSFCGADEIPYLRDIEKLTRTPLTVVDDHRYHSAAIAALRRDGDGATRPGNGQETIRGASGGRSRQGRSASPKAGRPARGAPGPQDREPRRASRGESGTGVRRGPGPQARAPRPPAPAPDEPSFGRRRRPADPRGR